MVNCCSPETKSKFVWTYLSIAVVNMISLSTLYIKTINSHLSFGDVIVPFSVAEWCMAYFM